MSPGARLLLGLLVGAASCSGDAERPDKTELSVFAAASLTDAFTAIEAAFEQANPDVDVVTSFAGSQVLRLQIEQGARGHIFASANENHAQALEDGGFAGPPELLAYNRLAIIVPPDNPAGLEGLGDLPAASRLVVASETVPLGRYTRGLFEAAGRSGIQRPGRTYISGPDFEERVQAAVVSEENNARLVRAKVELGEADAAIVYLTDALTSDRVRMIELPGRFDFTARYVISPLRAPDGSFDEAAVRYIRFAQSEQGRALLRDYGFTTEAGPEGE